MGLRTGPSVLLPRFPPDPRARERVHTAYPRTTTGCIRWVRYSLGFAGQGPLVAREIPRTRCMQASAREQLRERHNVPRGSPSGLHACVARLLVSTGSLCQVSGPTSIGAVFMGSLPFPDPFPFKHCTAIYLVTCTIVYHITQSYHTNLLPFTGYIYLVISTYIYVSL